VLFAMVFLGTTPIGGLLVGWVSEQWGPRAGLAVGGVAAAAAGGIALVVMAVRRRRRHRRPVEASEAVAVPARA